MDEPQPSSKQPPVVTGNRPVALTDTRAFDAKHPTTDVCQALLKTTRVQRLWITPASVAINLQSGLRTLTGARVGLAEVVRLGVVDHDLGKVTQ